MRTSLSHPLQIDEVATRVGGIIGLTICPGKVQAISWSGPWDRSLEVDVAAISEWGARAVVTLVTKKELEALGIAGLGDAFRKEGITWFHLPINDVDVPDADWERSWALASPILHRLLADRGRVLVHCRAGLGRAGTVAAVLLAEEGVHAPEAIAIVRAARPGAIQTQKQEEYVVDKAERFAAAFADRAKGALLGLAVGDALGTTLEFSRRDERPKHTEMTGGGPFGLEPGVWTDDTSMALCLADNLLANGGLEPHDLMQRFGRWWREGENSPVGRCFDIGTTTYEALARFERTGDPNSGDSSINSAGNGSLMRLSPIALFFKDDETQARAAARRQSEATHAATECLDACDWFAGLLVRAINGDSFEDLFRYETPVYGPKVSAVAAGSWRHKSRSDICSSGYVIDTLEAAVWAVSQASSFEEAVIIAVNLGDDSDTVGAVTGQLAGAIWGYASIPERWTKKLAWRTHIEQVAVDLLRSGAKASERQIGSTMSVGV